MTGTEIFAVVFLAWIMVVMPMAVAWELGVKDIVADKIVKFIDSLNNKKKSI